MSQKISELPLNALVKDTETLFYGKPIIFRIADKNHEDYPENSVTLITDKIITLKAFDAQEPSNTDSNRKSYGNNRYIFSNLRQWLNSDKAANEWYTASHSADAPPTKAACLNYNGYDTQPGFLNGFSTNMKAALISTVLTVAKNTVTDGGGFETCTDKVFLASTTEIGLANENNIMEGLLLAVFNNNTSRIANPTTDAVTNSDFQHATLNTGVGWVYWLRTPSSTFSQNARLVNTDGTLINVHARNGSQGVRPLCNLSSEIMVSDTADADGAYTIVWGQSPNEDEDDPPPTGGDQSPYIPTVWKNGKSPAINATNLNKIEQGIAAAHSQKAEKNHKHDLATAAVAGFVRALNGNAAQFLNGMGEWADVVPLNHTHELATTAAAGFLRVLNNDPTQFLNGAGSWADIPTAVTGTVMATANNTTNVELGFQPKCVFISTTFQYYSISSFSPIAIDGLAMFNAMAIPGYAQSNVDTNNSGSMRTALKLTVTATGFSIQNETNSNTSYSYIAFK